MRKYINAKFLLADPPPAVTIYPAHVRIKQIKPRVAMGARKPRLPGRGDGVCDFYAAKSTSQIIAMTNNYRNK